MDWLTVNKIRMLIPKQNDRVGLQTLDPDCLGWKLALCLFLSSFLITSFLSFLICKLGLMIVNPSQGNYQDYMSECQVLRTAPATQ